MMSSSAIRNENQYYADPLPQEVDPHKLPEHVAVIMDGNGRWAKAKGLPRAM